VQALHRSQFKDLQVNEGETRQDTNQPIWICILFLSPTHFLLRESICRSRVLWSASSLTAEVNPLQYKNENQTTLSPVLLQLAQLKLAVSKAAQVKLAVFKVT